MTDATDETQEAARKALLEAIATGVADLRTSGYTLGSQSASIQSLALAYRYVAGGDQPQTLSVKVNK